MTKRPLPVGLVAALVLALAPAATARVVRVEILSREDVQAGAGFGDAGAYERLVGRVHFSVSVANPHNRAIVDLDRAENARSGEVEFSADVVILRPKDPRRGNGTLLLEVPNRGRSRIVDLVDGGDWNAGAQLGDAWLLKRGFTFAALGWQWDASGDGALRLQAPVAKDHGAAITGLLRGDVMLAAPTDDLPLGHLILGQIGGSEYPVAAPDDPRNVLTVRSARSAPRQVVPRDRWQFAHVVDGTLQPSPRHIHLAGGFQPGLIYEYVYVVANPVVAGLGFAAVRDFAAYAKGDPEAVAPVRRVIGEGISQNGRFLRDLVYQGCNADERGRPALDGVLAHVAGAGRGSFNQRFAQPSRDAQPTSSVFFPTDVFPFTDLPETDPLTGERDGLLARATAEGVVPKIFLSNTSYEYWGRAASLTTTTADGTRDVALSPEVRVYHFTGLQHFSGPWPPAKGTDSLQGRFAQSPLPVRYFWRAMIANMDAWLRGTVAPPESVYPRIGDGTLVAPAAYAFPALPGVVVPRDPNEAWRLDFGPGGRQGIASVQPPAVGAAFPLLVPQVDTDGNELGGIRLPELAAPLATYASWNPRDPAIGGPDQRVAFEGAFLPFARDAAARQAAGDPRPSIAERYQDRSAYTRRFAEALDDLIRRRFILPEDRGALLRRGDDEWEYAHHD